ncbi:hypothetical protein BZA05DRAFT_121879 [Tricharina praecox]|uniref:uncharacterized protein n=1 Tax=Tricharina praecox TaxID=43433 RepID=UPI00221E3F7E|nr:uncharacterized protein BZA05DRAFT_121879 [Tricharina praecox]KAI5848185.1 hypothetical protein BZA05DRAFT_121879 [Tricharina praecox]
MYEQLTRVNEPHTGGGRRRAFQTFAPRDILHTLRTLSYSPRSLPRSDVRPSPPIVPHDPSGELTACQYANIKICEEKNRWIEQRGMARARALVCWYACWYVRTPDGICWQAGRQLHGIHALRCAALRCTDCTARIECTDWEKVGSKLLSRESRECRFGTSQRTQVYAALLVLGAMCSRCKAGSRCFGYRLRRHVRLSTVE